VRVVVVTNDLPPRVGGIQYYVDQLCRGLGRAGDEVTVYGSTSEAAAEFDAAAPYAVVRERTSVLLPTPAVRRHTARLVERTAAEVVLFGAAFPLGLMAAGLARSTGVPSVAFTHGLEVSTARLPGGSRALARVGRGVAAVTYVSHWCRDQLEPAFGPGPRHAMLPPAVDPREFHPGVDGAAVRRRWGIGDAPLVVCVSRLVARKGQDRLIDSVDRWRRQAPGTRLMVVGDGPHRGALESRARQRGVEDAVVFTGQVPDAELPAHFAAGDVFAMPCRERRAGREVEAFGIVFIQAQAVGVPVVAGAIGGVPDTLEEGRTGLLVDGTDTDAVAAAVGDLLADDGRRAAMGAAGARRVAEGFTWDQRTAELRGLLAEVAGGPAGAQSLESAPE
jgi:phosphatidylinositol alpha-1,6-mannosyltransferase